MRIAVITGVSRGLGQALAEEGLRREMRIFGLGRSNTENSSILENSNYSFHQCDLKDPESAQEVLSEVLTESKSLSPRGVYLLNNAAVTAPLGLLHTLEYSDIENMVRVNMLAPIALARTFCSLMLAERFDRRIINISSGAAKMPVIGNTVYSITKAALEMLTVSLGEEYNSARICSIAVHPGVIDTDMQRYLREESDSVFPLAQLFRDYHAKGFLSQPSVVARKIFEFYVLGAVTGGVVYERLDPPSPLRLPWGKLGQSVSRLFTLPQRAN